jgi:dTDP-4-dehydrorhamnose reductase
MKILLLGKTGQVGFELHRALSPLGHIDAPGRTELDLMSAEGVSTYLTTTQPDLIVNAAAWTGVDSAEEQRAESERLNADLPKQLAEYAAANNVRLVHYSSDYVYPGKGIEPWRESSTTEPVNHYGMTKLKGDHTIEESRADFLIFRVSWVYSARGNNFMKTMLRLAKEKTELNIVADQMGAPTPARLIAQITALGLHQNIPAGVYNLAPRGETSWHGFAQEIFRLAQHRGEKLNMGPDNALPIPTSAYPTPATRPQNSRLDISKLEQTLNITLPHWQSRLELTLDEYLEK